MKRKELNLVARSLDDLNELEKEEAAEKQATDDLPIKAPAGAEPSYVNFDDLPAYFEAEFAELVFTFPSAGTPLASRSS